VLVSYNNNNSVFAAPTIKDSNLRVSTVAIGLSKPTSMAFLGPNDILVLEKNTGLVKRVKNGVLLPGSLLDLSVATDSERGLLGIDVTNVGTSTTQFNVFLYYTVASSDGGTAAANRLSKYSLVIDPKLGGSEGRMTLSAVLLNLPVTPGPNHDGGKVAVGPDSNVYTVIGDVNRKTQAQNFETGPAPDGTGGILRVTQDGKTVGSGIIGASDPLNKYFAFGVRNAFGLDFDPVTKKLWDTENGPSSNDEINLADPGFNSGWKDLMGFAPSGFNFNNLVNFGGKGIYSNPEFVWTEVVAPTALKFFASSKLGSNYQNDLFVADYIKGRIYDFNLNSARTGLDLSGSLADKIANTDTEAQAAVFGEGFGGITDLKVGQGDGFLYVLSYGNGAIYRVTTTADTTPPTVVSTTPASGDTGVPVSSTVTATFSEAVQASTVTSAFTLKAGNTPVSGQVTLSPNQMVATFTPSSPLAGSTLYTATITTAVKDAAGNSLAADKVWSFTTAAGSPPPSCTNLPVSSITASGSQRTYPPENAIDNNLNTRWYSTFSVNPWIQVDLGAQKSVCRVDIAWADGASRQYSFTISLSVDGAGYTNVFSGKSSGTSTSFEKYNFAASPGRYVKVTVTQSHVGSANSIAQISELDIYGSQASSSSQVSSSSASSPTASTEIISSPSNDTTLTPLTSDSHSQSRPVAKDDKYVTGANKPIVAAVLENDLDPDRNGLMILSVSSPTLEGGHVTTNENGTLTFIPLKDFVGKDSFSYSILDGKGKSDLARVDVTVKEQDDRKQNQVFHPPAVTEEATNNGSKQDQTQAATDQSKQGMDTVKDSTIKLRASSKSKSVTQDTPPRSVAGDNKIANEGLLVTLDGSKSFDQDSKIVSYTWKQLSGPPVILKHTNEIRSNFVAPSVEQDLSLVFQLTVTDEDGKSNSDVTVVRVLNNLPKSPTLIQGETDLDRPNSQNLTLP
jgi:glucose/arabinose dehydrogenase